LKIALYYARYGVTESQIPPGLQYLAGYLSGKNLLRGEDILFANSAREAIDFKPDILGIGSVSQTINDAVDTASEVKKALPDCWTVLGGYHISALPETLPKIFDIGVIGEGEQTLAEIVSYRMKSLRPLPQKLRSMQGICCREENGLLIKTEPRPLIRKLDELPPPLRRIPYGQKWAYLFSARGCPYRCMYCASHSFWRIYRPHSAEYVINEIEKLVRDFGVSSVYFVDDLFIAPKQRLREIRFLMEQKGWLGRLRFKGFVRANLVDEETIRILKELGFTEVRFGMETASERLLARIKDQPFTIEQAENTIALCKKYRLPVCASFMFGIPGETERDISASMDFVRKHRRNFYISGFYIMQPVPGSRLWDDCLRKGLVSTDMNFSSLELDLLRKDFDWEKVLYLNGENISFPRFREIIEEIRSEFFRPGIIARALQAASHLLAKGGATARIFRKAGFELQRILRGNDKKIRTSAAVSRGLKLYVGCGEDTKEGYTGCDIRSLPTVSIVCKAWEVSYHCREVSEIYSRHMLEHLTIPQVEATLRDWLTALAEGGKVHIIVPNIDFHIRQWQRAVWDEENWNTKFSDARHSFAGFWGWQREADSDGEVSSFWDVHKSGFNADFLAFMLRRAGFSKVQCSVVNDVHVVGVGFKPLKVT
jgi:radical SAM superfamily enzyme YgiQ (UPF0313 family)